MRPLSRRRRYAFLSHAVVAGAFGLTLFVVPDQIDLLVGWTPPDPVVNRVLGAALLALAWSSWRGSQAAHWHDVQALVEMEAVFTLLGSAGLLVDLLAAPGATPRFAWVLFAILVLYASAWVGMLVRRAQVAAP